MARTLIRIIGAAMMPIVGLLVGVVILIAPGQPDPFAMLGATAAFVGGQSLLALSSGDRASRRPLLLLIGLTCLLALYLMIGLPIRMTEAEVRSFAVLAGVVLLQGVLAYHVARRRSAAALTCAIGSGGFGVYGVVNATSIFRSSLGWEPAMVYAMALALFLYAALITAFGLGLRWHRGMGATRRQRGGLGNPEVI